MWLPLPHLPSLHGQLLHKEQAEQEDKQAQIQPQDTLRNDVSKRVIWRLEICLEKFANLAVTLRDKHVKTELFTLPSAPLDTFLSLSMIMWPLQNGEEH